MESVVDLLRANYVPFWLHWSAWASAVAGFLAYMGIVLLARIFLEGKLYFGNYLSFVVAGVCLPVLFALASQTLDGRTPDAFYTELWFYAVLCGFIYAVIVKGKGIEADIHEQKNKRPTVIRTRPSERTHTYWALPFLFISIGWLALLAGDIAFFWSDKHWEELIAALIAGAVMLVGLFVLDSGRPVPQSLEEWMRFWPSRVAVLIITTAATLGSLLTTV